MAHDMVIRGGTVVDGSGGKPFQADVAIDGDRVSIIGTVSGTGAEEIDATGCIVTPGFVDIMTGRPHGMPKWRRRAGMV